MANARSDLGLDSISPALPAPAGPLSEAVIARLAGPAPDDNVRPDIGGGRMQWLAQEALAEQESAAVFADDDLQLALYLCYEIFYGGLGGVDRAWEWDPGMLSLRARLESAFVAALRDSVGCEPARPERIGDLLFSLAADDQGSSLSRFLQRQADTDQFREFVIHRSAYQLKEGDPHSWAIPRLRGSHKSALLEIQSDEYGDGRTERMHSRLFAKTMRELGLDDHPGGFLGRFPGVTLATVNLMSLFGLHGRWRGAIVGHLAMFEMTSSIPNRRYGDGLRRLGFGAAATDFYDEHVEADAVHENIAAYDLAEGLARAEPELTSDIVFGARSLLLLERGFAEHLLSCWEAGSDSLRPETAQQPALSPS